MMYGSETTFENNKPYFSAGTPASPIVWIAIRCELSPFHSPTGYAENSIFRRDESIMTCAIFLQPYAGTRFWNKKGI